MVKDFYDDVYTKDPDKWISEDRDEFMYDALCATVPEPTSLLDYGCGNGHTLQYLSKRWPKTDFYGYDISTVAIEIAQKKVEATFNRMNDIKFDIITIMGVAEHFEDFSELKKLKDCLAPCGVIYIEVPNCFSYSDTKNEGFRQTYAGSGQMEWHLRRSSWRKIIKDNGFEIVKPLSGGRPAWEFVWIIK